MDNELTVIGSELPVLQAKGTYKYLKEITGNGAYYQVAWQKLADGYIALYGTTHNLGSLGKSRLRETLALR
ncbi:hypothetical protein [Lentilactobacillus buchneri]|uniref:hypothetical protein n=1 Tax=Lentilactobacillus buchneri TaxID=1581 RepID=UPI0020BF1080|nr:hypothetical protein [Lentilactobacillus buchneri]